MKDLPCSWATVTAHSSPPQITLTYQNATAPTVFASNMLSAIYDVNKDNFPDVLMVVPTTIVDTELQHAVQLFVGNGDGTFEAPNTITVTPNILPSAPDGSYGSPFAFADLNGDGKIDLVAAGSSSDGTTPQAAIALGNGDGTFQTPSILTFDGFGFAGTLALGQFTGDGKFDLLVEGGTEARATVSSREMATVRSRRFRMATAPSRRPNRFLWPSAIAPRRWTSTTTAWPTSSRAA